ncbi:Uncharacterized conserved protein WDR8, contains WD repeats [Phaffia rhodozyma]|uniref:Uncharacterized conserved protein WDR8, contains WD repeats n=1 Tax=Phaffia rhodozyma TaxID=264483 RepID=A0A0F7ST89_PHARH|nr:Uncharacterized conserved protein WDR8, contains WD repeats [Phaffia rhodozyma]
MDFTDVYPSSSIPVFSPGSNFIANAVSSRIIIRTSHTLQIVKTFLIPVIPPSIPSSSSSSPTSSLVSKNSQLSRRPGIGWSSSSSSSPALSSPRPKGPPEVTHLSFSPFGDKILAFCARPGVAFVFDLKDPGMSEEDGVEAMLEGGVEKLTRVEWIKSGNGKGLLAWSDFGLRLTIWNLDDPESRSFIQNFQFIAQGHAWSADNRLFYLAERYNSRDSVGVYDTLNDWKLVFRVPTQTASLQGISIAPRGGYIAVWDHALQYKLQLFLPPLKTALQTLPPPPLPAQVENIGLNYQPSWPDLGMGVRCVAWRPGGEWLAVGGWDGRIRILQKSDWGVIWVGPPVRIAPAGSVVWHEPIDWYNQTGGRGIVQYHLMNTPATISFIKPDPKQHPPKMGVSQLEWNQDGSLLMSRLENSPDCLILYPFPTADPDFDPSSLESSSDLPFSVLLQTRPILHATFHPTDSKKLALCTGSNGIYIWNGDWITDGAEGEGVAECIGIPSSPFSATSLKWAPDGETLIVMDNSRGSQGEFTLVFEAKEDAGGMGQDNVENSPVEEMSLITEEEEGNEAISEVSLKMHDLL